MRNLSEANVTQALERVFDDTPDPRLKELMQALVRHLHTYARETRLTREEWAYAMDLLLRAGKISSERRNEFIMFSDTFGLSALVDMMNGAGGDAETAFSQLGPFFTDGLPVEPSNIVDLRDGLAGSPVLFCGTVVDSEGKPMKSVQVDAWQTDDDGLYDVQIPELKTMRLRCRLLTDADGRFFLKTIKPLGYTAPMDGPGGQMLIATQRNIWRPGHYHFKLEAPGYRTLVTELFPEGDAHLDNDVAFGVRSSLVIAMPLCDSPEMAKQWGMPLPFAKVDYTFHMAPAFHFPDRC
jgi:protocatechuate 3,4-dioxygenase beta subunit